MPEIQPSHVKDEEEGEEVTWNVYHWKQNSFGELFFDQVAELENLTPASESSSGFKTFNDFDPGEGTSVLKDAINYLPESPSSDISDDKDSSDDSISLKTGCDEMKITLIGNNRKITKPASPPPMPSPNGCQKVLDKRVRNNQASKKFRLLRKGRHKALFDNLQSLENENYQLNVQLEQIIQEINLLKASLPKNCLPYSSLLE